MNNLLTLRIMKKIILVVIIITWAILISILLNNKEDLIMENSTFIKDTNIVIDEIITQKLDRHWLKTNTSKISIDFDDILDWWPGKDWIPSINNPKFIDIDDAEKNMIFLNESSRGISVELNWESKFYPYWIIVWHEIVNDEIWGKEVSVTFCPLCWTAIVYDRDIDWEIVTFWVSWLLYQSNLLMYDDKTESLWSQNLWEAVVWEYLWKELKYIKSNLMTFKEFKKNYPKWKILSDDTWFNRNYWNIPYWDYDESDTLYFPVKNQDLRFNKKEIFYIINDDNESIAFLLKDLIIDWSGELKVWNEIYSASYIDWIVDVKKWDKLLKWYYEMWFSWVNHNKESKNVWFIK